MASTFVHVGHLGTGLVAIGSQCPGVECVGSSFWSSPDGVAWIEHGAYQDFSVLAGLSDGPFGVVAVGADWSTGYPEYPPDVAAYRSTDGTTWTRTPNGAGSTGATMGAVATHGTGLVALGNSAAGLTAWTSTDGQAWQPTGATALGSGEVRALVDRGSRLIAVGRDGQDAVAWTSSDGVAWLRSAAGTTPLAAAAMEGLAATATTVVAVGQDRTAGTGAIWTSADGTSWTKAGSLPGTAVELDVVAIAGEIIVVFGRTDVGAVVILRAEAAA